MTAMAAAILLSGCTSEKPVETSQNEISAENSAQPEEQKIIDKNLKLEVPYVL